MENENVKNICGTYTAKVERYGIPDTDKEHPQVCVIFSFDNPHGQGRLEKAWYGSLHPNAIEYTLKTLFICGLQGDDLGALLDPSSGALQVGKEVSIKIEPHTYNGKTYQRISWVNALGGENFKAMPVEKAHSKLSHLTGYVAQQRKAQGFEEKAPF